MVTKKITRDIIAMLAEAGGLGHDLGKAGSFFAEKLERSVVGSGTTTSDPVRHEWLSMRLLQQLRVGRSVDQAWDRMAKPIPLCDTGPLMQQGITSAAEALDYLIVTHHKLFSPGDGIGSPGTDRHVRDKSAARDLHAAGQLPDLVYENIRTCLDRVTAEAAGQPPAFWRGCAFISRAALVLADHQVSARAYPNSTSDVVARGNTLYANTKQKGSPTSARKKNRYYDQPLEWHLREVAYRARVNAQGMTALQLRGLPEQTIERATQPSDPNSRFAWQNRAFDAVNDLRRQVHGGLLVFNVAATGAGKTVANAKLACAVSPERPRFSVALNLRSLTLQTTDALKASFGLAADEMVSVIGDTVAKQLHDADKQASDKSGNQAVEDAETDIEPNETEYHVYSDQEGSESKQSLPDWLEDAANQAPILQRTAAAPVLVSTIDFLINAGEPGRQAHHVAAMVRMLDSDLVLDEIDSYDPKALVAVLRLIQVAGLCGRSVICSSATLPQPVAAAAHQAFASGTAMRCAMEGRPNRFGTAIVDDQIEPVTYIECGDHESGAQNGFADVFRSHTRSRMQSIASASTQATLRRGFIEPVATSSEDSFFDGIQNAIEKLHEANAWEIKPGHRISFGLVRVANIDTAIEVTRRLAEVADGIRVVCYHAKRLRIQRYLLERRLDFLLSRKGGDEHIRLDECIDELLTDGSSTKFVVVATPVEEIGRDHDFDWAVIEPSSAHSIVQVAGRVNRHRLLNLYHGRGEGDNAFNIALLQHNYRRVRRSDSEPCFVYPGLESFRDKNNRYSSSDLEQLLANDCLPRIDAGIRLGDGVMAHDEDRLIDRHMEEPMKVLEARSGYSAVWMTHGFYQSYPLRGGNKSETWRLPDPEQANMFERLERSGGRTQWLSRRIEVAKKRLPNLWLTPSADDMVLECDKLGISVGDGFQVQVPIVREDEDLVWDQSVGFFARRQ